MKISTLSRKKSISDTEKRKMKMMLFPAFILLLVSARHRNMKINLSAHSFKILNKPKKKAKILKQLLN